MNQTQKIKNIVTKCVEDITLECQIINITNRTLQQILSACLEDIEKILQEDKDKDKDNDDKENILLDVGVCCFCSGECNPLSQSCGSCSRGLSGAALGLPVPDHLQQFLHR